MTIIAKVHVHGCISVVFVIAAMVIGFIAIFQQSLVLAVCYAILVLIGYSVVAAVYCSKCPCRGSCNHLFVGMISKLLSKPNESPYTKSDMVFGAVLPITVIMILPQFWLVKSPVLLLSFWVLLLTGAAEIILFVCKGCRNRKCSMCR
jgi:hypothetical protein